MKLKHEMQPCASSTDSDHEWEPLFAPPLDRQQKAHYMAHGHGDYMKCATCGMIAMRDGASSPKPLSLSQVFSDSKKREAAIWNAHQERFAERAQSSSDKAVQR